MKTARILICLAVWTQMALSHDGHTDDPRKDPILRMNEPSVVLESAGDERPQFFSVPESIAFQSSVIKKAVHRAEDIGEPVRNIKFDDISPLSLKIFIETMQVMRDAYDKDPKVTQAQQMEEIENKVDFPEEISLATLKELLNQSAYLHLQPLVQVMARFVARALHEGEMTRQDLEDISQELISEVARHYYLIYNEFIEGISVPYGVSVRELLSLNRLPEIPEHFEYDLSKLRINDLDGLSQIPGISKVKKLNLSHNQLAVIKPGNFEGLGGLETLTLSYNKFTHLPAKIFRGLGSLTNLTISHNDIDSLEIDVFVGLGSLKRLDLSSNLMTNFSEQLFSGLGNMEWLNLSNNRLKVISYKTFKDIAYLKELNLQDNQLTKLCNMCFAELSNLEILNVSYNELKIVEPKAFDGLVSLRVLNLSTNQIRQLPGTVFQDLKTVVTLSLSHNLLPSLDVYLFRGLDKLIDLDVSHNELKASDFATGVFSGPKNLEILRASYNQLNEVPAELFAQARNLMKLYVLGNPIPMQTIAQLAYRYKNVDIIFWEGVQKHAGH